MEVACRLWNSMSFHGSLGSGRFFNSIGAGRITNTLIRVRDGVEALDYLFARGAFAGRDVRDLPAVVLLDWNLPRVDGLTVLKSIRADKRCKHLPVVILTSSNEDKDRLAAYSEYANSYVQKPVDYDRFLAASRELGLYWLVLNQRAPVI